MGSGYEKIEYLNDRYFHLGRLKFMLLKLCNLDDLLNLQAIPKKFAFNMREELSETMVLKGPTGASWTVGLSASDNTLFFERGWGKFVEDNSLEENDLLMFKYNRNLYFDVQMFDGRSFCEKETSYFVRKCHHLELDKVGGTKKNCTTQSLDTFVDSSANESGSSPLKEHMPSEVQMSPKARYPIQPTRKIQKTSSS